MWPGVCERLSGPVEDPTAFEGPEAERLSKFREVREQIGELVKTWVREKTAPHLAG